MAKAMRPRGQRCKGAAAGKPSLSGEAVMSRIRFSLIFLALAGAAGCSTADELAADGPLAYPNVNTQAVARPEGLMTPQQSAAEIAALNARAAEQMAAARREIEGRR